MSVTKKNGRIVIKCSAYGSIEISRDRLITLLDGVNGNCANATPGPGSFVILGLKRYAPFLLLVSAKNPHVSYPIINPRVVFPEYKPPIPYEELCCIGNPEMDCVQVMTTVELDLERRLAFTDLKHPILVNVRKRLAKQVEVDSYPEKYEIPVTLLRQ